MLNAMRRATKSWVMKAILALLALTFVVFFGGTNFGGGHGGGQGGRNTNAVVEVGSIDFTLNQVGRTFSAQLQQISRASGQQIDPQSPIAAAVLDQAIGTLVTGALYDVAARDLGVAASDAAVEDAIRRIPAFRGVSGGFDRSVFGGFLRQAGMSEAQFIASAREELQRDQYLGTLRAGIAAPDAMVDAFYKYRGERRVVELVTVSTATVEGLSPPDEAQLAKFYEDNRQFFQAPEYREATMAGLSVEKLAATINIPDEEVAEFYARRLNSFQRPERREILQAIFLDRESAEKAAALIAQGQPFAEAVEEHSGLPPVSMGTVERAQISSTEVAEAAFSTDAGGVAGPIESPLGWELVSVVAIQPEQTQPLSEVSDRLRQALALEQARDDVFDVLNKVEDGLAAGATLEEVASNSGLELQKLEAFSARGIKRDGEVIAVEPLAEVVTAVFSTAAGEVGDVVQSRDGGFFVVRVDTVTPPQIEPLERVRDQATAAWLDNERLARATERATQLAERARGGESLEQLAAEAGATFEVTPPFDRTGLGSTIAGTLITPIFAAQQGDVVQAQVQNGVGVARLVEIQAVDSSNDNERADLRAQLADGINQDLAQQLTAALRARYSIDVDRATIEQSLLAR